MKLLKSKLTTFTFVFFIVLLVLAIPAGVIYENTKNYAIVDVGHNAKNIASTVATFIESDIEPYKELTSIVDYKTENYDELYYNKMLKLFRKLKKETNASFIYTEKKVSDTQLAYVLDGEDPDSKFFSPLGSTDTLLSYEITTFDQGVVVSTKLMDDPVWGKYFASFAPIKDNDTGAVIGLVGVDFSYDYFKDIIDNIRTIILLSFLTISLLISIVIVKLLDSRSKSMELDYMTGIHSKYYHDHLLKKMIKEAYLKNKPLSLIMIDLDNFKEINDQFGHLVGDKVLKSVAHIVQENIRSVDTCSRYAGDEFVIILPDTTKEHAEILGNRILKNISRFVMPVKGMDLIRVSLSMGIAQWSEHMSSENLTECADHAMYISKKTGKNKITIYKDKINFKLT